MSKQHRFFFGILRALMLSALLCLAACQLPVSPTPVITESNATQTTSPALHPTLGDLRVRQAIAHCTDRIALIRAVYPWLEETEPYEMGTFLTAGHPFFAAQGSLLQQYPYDAAQGEALLESAGWTLLPGATFRTNAAGDVLSLQLQTTGSEFHKTWVPVFIDQMQTCGVQVEASYLPAAEFYASEGALVTRDFDLAVYARLVEYAPRLRLLFACQAIPSLENGWQGENFSGWCNAIADQAALEQGSSPAVEDLRSAYRVVQEEYARDLPGLPLFRRMGVSAARAEVQNYSPLPAEVYTWNAAQWSLPGSGVITIGERSEPAGLHPLDDSWVNQTVRALLDGSDYIRLGYGYQPVTLREFPTLENGGSVLVPVTVEDGTAVVDAEGNPVPLAAGVRVVDEQGMEREFTGSPVVMSQLLSTYKFYENLTWSDGTPVTLDDYRLAFAILCNPEAAGEFLSPLKACNFISEVFFDSDTAYTVAWKPGYREPLYFLPPFGRLPAHQQTEAGRLRDVPPSYWQWLDEVNHAPLGIGPYTLSSWEFGREMVFNANPYYYGEPPATPEIIIRFIPQAETAASLLRGEIDILDWTSLLWEENSTALLHAQQEGSVQLYFFPDLVFEQIDFDLSGE